MNISSIHNCYGCGICAIVCTKNIIEIRLNVDGFYEPSIISEKACTNCGLCSDVCTYLHDNLLLQNLKIKSYAAWSKDVAARRKCSSGGVSFELGRTLINQGYKVCGVRYNAETARAEHYIATTIEELIPSIGSKYIQSYTVDGFKAINRKKKYLITGTPCQIGSFRRYIQKFQVEDNFVLMDFFCHGVPSMLVWQKYTKEVEKTTGKITYAAWRHKIGGWQDSWLMAFDGEANGEVIDWHDSYNTLIKERKSVYMQRYSQGNAFFRIFLSNACLGKVCYKNCKYKYNISSADIRIGDLWGNTYQKNQDGVNGVITFTVKGEEVLHSCNLELKSHTLDVVTEGQMKHNPKGYTYRQIIMFFLRNKSISLNQVLLLIKPLQLYNKTKRRFLHPIRTIKKAFKIMNK